LVAVILGAVGCASSPPDERDSEDKADGEAVTMAATWRFDFVDTDEKSMGHMLLVFTEDRIDEPTCGNDSWQKMQVLEDNLDFDFGVDSRPAYSIHGPWLTIDLTSSVCYLDHVLIGNIAAESASGFFNMSHQIGGQNLGSFTAQPISKKSAEGADTLRR